MLFVHIHVYYHIISLVYLFIYLYIHSKYFIYLRAQNLYSMQNF